ncbi:MAG TPA: hypothetical protein VFV95_13595 [Vicinamibacterales bacterium]|nr:hypothetical protein [Vicinamibacterales bacterium]
MICGAIGRPASITASGSALSEAHRSTPATAAGSSSLRRSTIRRAAPILALLYLGAHIWFLPPALEDIDSINFALALHDFDPVLHRPHPPGYPVYVAMGKVTRPIAQRLWPGTDAQGIDAKTLGLWSAAGGAIALVLLVWLVKEASELSGDEHADLFPLAIAMMLGAAPLFWMSGLRPLSDMPGLAAAIGVQAALLRACRAGLRRQAGALSMLGVAAGAAGLALGIRSQILWLTAPALLAAAACHWRAGIARAASVAVAAFAAGALVWAVPLVIATGGLDRYLSALGTLAGEDFSNVPMLWTRPTPRQLAFALLDTFVRPWGSGAMAVVVLATAVAGSILVLLWQRALAGWLAVLYAPYLVFHLLFQDTSHTRYALPLLVPVVWIAARLLVWIGPRTAVAAAAVIAGASLAEVLPVARIYGTEPLPAAAAVNAAREAQARDGGVLAGHFDFARPYAAEAVDASLLLPSPLFAERQELVKYWRSGGRGPVWFVAAPARTDLHLVDAYARTIVAAPAWPFSREWFLGGTRPERAELVRIASPPGWVAGEGWHLTREALILADRRAAADATMLVARRPEAALAFIGGEYLPSPGDGPADLSIALDGTELRTIALLPDRPQFLERIPFPPGSLSGPGTFASLRVAWHARAAASMPRVHLTQFELQPPDRTFWVYGHGWHDLEIDVASGQEWRWTSERAEVAVHTAGRDVEMQIVADVPIADLDGAPVVTIGAAGVTLRTLHPRGRFTDTVRVPADVVDRAGGVLVMATDRTLVPDERTGSGDRRHLGVRVYELRLNPVAP